ncbi:MAG: tandem-95 repeat protein, partial [Candidatus Thorarchaeota archaeon]
ATDVLGRFGYNTYTILSVNQPPDAVDDGYTVLEDNPLTIEAPGVLDNDNDVDGDTLTVLTYDGVSENGGVVAMAGDGSFTYTPAENCCGEDSFTYTVGDGNEGTDTATVSVDITCVNDPPLADDDNYSTNEDTPLTVPAPGVLDGDTDVESEALTAVLDSPTSSGSLTLNSDGSFDYTPNADYCGLDSFTYHANDSQADSNVATVSIDVVCVNDPPLADDDNYSTNEDTSLNVATPGVLDGDSDVDGDTLRAVLDTTSSGSLTLNDDGSFDYTPTANYCGPDSFTYHASDSQVDSNVAAVTIDVVCVNDPPAFTLSGDVNVAEDFADIQSVTVLPGPVPVDETDQIVTYSLSPESVSFANVSIDSATGEVTITAVPNGNGSQTFTVTADDGQAVNQTHSEDFTLTVQPVNDPPELVPIGDPSTDEDVDKTILLAATDVDIATNGQSLTFSAQSSDVTLVQVAVSSTGNGSGELTFDVQPDQNGSAQITVTVDDGNDGTDFETFTLTVIPVNDPPVISEVHPGSQSVQYSDGIAPVTITASDIDSSQLTISASDLLGGLTLTPNPGCVPEDDWVTCTWTLSGAANVPAGEYSVQVTVIDDDGGQAVADIVFNVASEEAKLTFDSDNPVGVQVAEPEGNSGQFSLTVHVQEAVPDAGANPYPGDISLADVSMILEPVGPGGLVEGVCVPGEVTGSEYDAVLPVTCSFNGVEVNTYTAEATVGGGYYAGYAEDVLVVYDPSLGFATGGGWFYWPDSDDPDTGYPGDKTNFGFTMKYNKKGTNVQGSLLLIRHMTDGSIYRVKSNALYGLAVGDEGDFGWASFSGKSTYKEPDWPEPKGNYEFVVYVEDWDEPGTGTDRFW